jgi:hypothetical protein
MVRVILAVREPGVRKPDFYVPFDLPEVPRVGDYISIFRPYSEAYSAHSEDLVVRHVWWHLQYPDTEAVTFEETKAGRVNDVMVECDMAIGPYARENWRASVERWKATGSEVVVFDVERFSVSESRLKKMGKE